MMTDRSILVVEDNPDDEVLTVHALRKHRLDDEIEVVRDGVEALEFLFGEGRYEDRKGVLPSLVLLDLKLPKLDGQEVLRRLRANQRTRLLPVIILTSSDEESDLIEGYTSGVNAYVRKPLDFADFRRAVELLGLFWLVYNQPPPR